MSSICNSSHRLLALIMLGVSLVGLWSGAGPARAAAPAPAGAAAQAVAAGLTHDQERTVLRLIDDICADTWCSGDYAFAFRRFSCQQDRATCRLALRIAPLGDEPLRWRWRSGTVQGFTRFDQMVRTSESGQQSLEWDFYEAVNTVVGEIEATFPASASS